MTQRITLAGQTQYAALLEALLQAEALASGLVGRPGTFVSKTIKGRRYWYFQYRELGRQLQAYVGPHTPEVEGFVGRALEDLEELRASAASRARLVAMAQAGGCLSHTVAEREVLKLLASAGVFRAGGVLVGSAAFLCYGNMLGRNLAADLARTEDVDVVSEPALYLALKPEARVSPLPTSGDSPAFQPVPPLNHKHPSTSFHVRGTDLRLDVLTPLVGRPRSTPVVLPGLGVAAHPLRFLDYLIAEPAQAAVVSGEGVLVTVPGPGRFALHKLLVASERTAAFATKSTKDRRQAELLLDALLEDRPGDLLLAWDALIGRGSGWTRRVKQALGHLDEELVERVSFALEL